ncbi:hypothetical protein AB4383_16110 [Vibrio breoganii]
MKRSILYGMGSVCYAILQWLLIVVYSRYIGIESVGAYSLYLSVLTPIIILVNGGLRVYIAADINKDFSSTSYVTLRVVFIVMFFLITLSLSNFMQYKDIFIFCCILKGIDSLSDLEYGAWNRDGEIINYFYSQLYRLVITFTLMYVCYSFGFQDVIYFSVPLAMLLVYFLHDRAKTNVSFNIESFSLLEVRRLFLSSYKIGVGALLAALTVTITRQMIEHFSDLKSLAEYIYITYFYNIMSIASLSISQVNIPIVARGESFSRIKNIFYFLTLFSVGYVVFILLFSERAIHVFYGVDINYSLVSKVSVAIGGVAYFFGVFINSFLVAKRRVTIIFNVNLILFIMNAIIVYSMLVLNVKEGAFYAFAICGLLMLLINVFFVVKLKVINVVQSET